MATLRVIKCVWTGVSGLPGVNTFYATSDPSSPTTPIRAFYDAIKAQLAPGVSIQVPSSGDTIEETTGEITGSWSVTPAPAVVVSGGSGVYAAPVGAVVNWHTDGIVNGRRVRGKTFLVPLDGDAFQSDGSLGVTALGVIRAAADALAAAADPISVWHRPTLASPGPPPVYNADGEGFTVNAASVPDMAAVLRSRRD
jgi:hypothetical protein